MLFTAYSDVSARCTGITYSNTGTPQDLMALQVLKNEELVAHRHKISLIGDDAYGFAYSDQPSPAYIPVLSGALFTAANGYAGPGAGAGNNVYSIGTYGGWQSANWPATQAGFWTNTNAWESWFQANSPATERFVYLVDESSNYPQTQQWANWMKTNPGIGANLKSLATENPIASVASTPSLSITTGGFTAGVTAAWQNAVTAIEADPRKEYWMYNGPRPGQGAFSTEVDGSDLREKPWGQYKKGVGRWFFWESTYYNDYQTGSGQKDLFSEARTFGSSNPTPESLLWTEGQQR